MHQILTFGMTLVALPSIAICADVCVGGLLYADVEIIEITEEQVRFRFHQTIVSQSHDKVTRVVFGQGGDRKKFDLAENLLRQDKTTEAIGILGGLRSSADKAVRILAGRRMQRLAKATGAPSTQPSAETPIGPWVTAESFFKCLREAPASPSADRHSWSGLTELQRQEARDRHEAQLAKWREANDYRGRQVTWFVQAQDVKQNRATGGFILKCTCEAGGTIAVRCDEALRGNLADVGKNAFVRVAGRIRDHSHASAARVGASMVVLLGSAPDVIIDGTSVVIDRDRVRLFGVSQKADAVVLVLDRSGSMITSFDGMLRMLETSTESFAPRNQIHVIFLGQGMPLENPPRKLIAATPEAMKRLRQFLARVRPEGKTDPLPALTRAFHVLKRAEGRKTICLVTDAVVRDERKMIQLIQKMNPDHAVRINTVLYGSPLPQSVALLKKVAKENGGTYRFLLPRSE